MSVFAIVGVIILFAFLVESLVEYIFGAIAEHVPVLKPYQWLLMYVAMAVGVLGAFVYKFDLINLASQFLEVDIPITTLGIVISGMAIGRGSNYIHQLVSKFFKKPDAPKVIP
jgi:hypothetical protein